MGKSIEKVLHKRRYSNVQYAYIQSCSTLQSSAIFKLKPERDNIKNETEWIHLKMKVKNLKS